MEWLTDPNVMEVSDQIERVNRKMFEKLKMRNEHLAVLFCRSILQIPSKVVEGVYVSSLNKCA